MTGGTHFCEIFLDDVRVPAGNRIGGENEGWDSAQSTLGAERGLTMVQYAEHLKLATEDLFALALTEVDGQRPYDDAAVRQQLARTHAEVEAFRRW